MTCTRSARWLGAFAVLAATIPTGLAGPATAAGAVQATATIDGQEVSRATADHPLQLRGDRPAIVRVSVSNAGTSDVVVRSVRIEGSVVGLMLFAYETRVDLRVPGRGRGEREYALDLVDLSKQAVGLLPAHVQLLDEQRHVISSEAFSTKVHGSLTSVYGLFGILVAGITALLLAGALLRLATHRLADNRWKRATTFGTAGLGLGLTLTFTLSALAVLLPSPGRWATITFVSGAALFGVGYLTPSPDGEERAFEAPVEQVEPGQVQPALS
jgi:hypothetical protein